jgi:hypothetical protein
MYCTEHPQQRATTCEHSPSFFYLEQKRLRSSTLTTRKYIVIMKNTMISEDMCLTLPGTWLGKTRLPR